MGLVRIMNYKVCVMFKKNGDMVGKLIHIVETDEPAKDYEVETENYSFEYFFFPTLFEARQKVLELKHELFAC